MATILTSIPKDANVTKIDYEGPRIALYTDKPRFLMENNEIISFKLQDQFVEKFIIVESQYDHQGNKKELNTQMQRSCMKQNEEINKKRFKYIYITKCQIRRQKITKIRQSFL